MKLHRLLVPLWLVFCGVLCGVELKPGEILQREYFFAEANRAQSYALYVPRSYDQSKGAPLVVVLHGLGATPDQVIRYKGMVDEAEKRGYVLVAPFGYNERGWYGSRGKGKTAGLLRRSKNDDPENLGELSELDVMHVLKWTMSELRIDENQVFLLGHSMGGAGAIHLGATYPKQWAGLACLAPAFHGSTEKLQGLKHLPVYVTSGDKDRLVRIELVRRWVAAMQALDMEVQFKEIPGGRHFRTITSNPAMMAEVFDFFDRQKR